MTCKNCKDPACALLAATQREHAAWVAIDGDNETAAAWKRASEALDVAQRDCADRKAYRTNADTLARLADIEARQDRIEAVLRAKGWML